MIVSGSGLGFPWALQSKQCLRSDLWSPVVSYLSLLCGHLWKFETRWSEDQILTELSSKFLTEIRCSTVSAAM